jgi:hypothetical protein
VELFLTVRIMTEHASPFSLSQLAWCAWNNTDAATELAGVQPACRRVGHEDKPGRVRTSSTGLRITVHVQVQLAQLSWFRIAVQHRRTVRISTFLPANRSNMARRTSPAWRA